MASRGIPPPRLPTPPSTLDPDLRVYLTDLTRALEFFIELENNPGEQRATKMTMTNLPTSDTGLEVGALFEIDGRVYISRADTSVLTSVAGTMALGSLTIVTT